MSVGDNKFCNFTQANYSTDITSLIEQNKQRCGTVTIFYGSGSDFWKVMVPVPTFDTFGTVPDPYLVSRPSIAIFEK